MKLELKHLASYLPYGLQVASGDWYDEDHELSNIGTMVMGHNQYIPNNISISQLINEGGQFKLHGIIRKKAKPILRPLSSLCEPLEEKDDIIELILDELSDNEIESIQNAIYFKEDNLCKNINFAAVSLMFEHHFDVFNLIGKNLAIKK